MTGEASRGRDAADRQRSALPGFSGDDDGRDVEASGGTASVITISACEGGVGRATRETAPAYPKPPAQAGAVALSDAVMVLAGAIAAYERCDLARAVEIAMCAYAEKIGCGVLARAVADAGETRNPASSIGGAGRLTPCPVPDGEDLFTVPEFRRVGENRFRGGGP